MQSSKTTPTSSSLFFRRSPPVRRRGVSFLRCANTLSWLPPHSEDDGCNGWSYSSATAPPSAKKTGMGVVLIGGVGALLAAISYFTVSTRGFGSYSLIGRSSSSSDIVVCRDDENVDDEIASSSPPIPAEKPLRFKVSIPVDTVQLEALSVLNKLKVIEDDVRANELCTRREYARWLLCLNSLLERNPSHRIVPSVSLSGSVIAAFDDVGVGDPDFQSIQALAEAGVVPSKLSRENLSDSSEGDRNFFFYPDGFISRQDLIDWKVQLEHSSSFKGMAEQMSKAKINYMDVKGINSDASPELFFDLLADDKSITRKVFGRSMRFQPHKPSTKAQAAVALTSGRMTEAINNEIARQEAENSSRQATMEEIRCNLLERGEIQKFWDDKINEERTRGAELEKLYIATLHDLEEEKISQVKDAAEAVKEKAAMDCQKQLLHTLEEEVNEMSEKLASEKITYIAEQRNLQKMLCELQTNQEELINKRSILEAEIEAIRILRSWVEDEARKSQARTKVLEEVARRWKWDNESGVN